MEQITKPLTAKIKSGHYILVLDVTIDNDSNGNIIILDTNISNEIELSSSFRSFLDTCIGNYTFNVSESAVTITFEDSRDFVQYLLSTDETIV